MQLRDISFQGPPIDDRATLQQLPDAYRRLLEQVNGFVQFGGGIHIRGICREPAWHSLTTVWTGTLALSKLYPAIQSTDVP